MRNTELRIGNIVEYLVHDELANPKSEWVENVVDLDDLRAIETSENYRTVEITEDLLYRLGFFMFGYKTYKCGVFAYDLQE